MSNPKKHNQEIVLLRGIAILAVIIIHVTAYFVKIPQINSLMITMGTIDFFTHFAVPLFVFISGFVLIWNYNSNFNIKDFYKKRLSRIIFPYLIFSLLYILLSSITPPPPQHYNTFIK